MARSASADAPVANAPATIRRAAISPRPVRNASTLSHMSTVATAAPIADSQASTRTLAHPGDSVFMLKNSRTTISM